MNQTDIEAIVSQPDAVLIRRGPELQEKLGHHTVPLFFFRGTAAENHYKGSGSGVLVQIQHRYFILTAGHCVEDAGDGGNEIAVGITDSPHRFVPKLLQRGCRHTRNTERDFGYFEVPAANVGTMKAQGRVFLAEFALDVALPEEFVARNDWMVISGFPQATMIGDPQKHPGAGLLGCSTSVATVSQIARTLNNYRVLDLSVSRDGNINTAEPKQWISAPALSGASGGGCWQAGVRPHPEQWTPSALRLVGIHTATVENPEDKANLLAREILIGHHLRLIAEDFEDLKVAMNERWPNLGEFDL